MYSLFGLGALGLCWLFLNCVVVWMGYGLGGGGPGGGFGVIDG